MKSILIFGFVVALALVGCLATSENVVVKQPAVKASLTQTAKYTLDRLTPKPPISFVYDAAPTSGNVVHIKTQPDKSGKSNRYQSIIGFGGAFTEAAALNFAGVNPLLK
jgi:hypothetical protein